MSSPGWALPEQPPPESAARVGPPPPAVSGGDPAGPLHDGAVVDAAPTVPDLTVFHRPLTVADVLDGGFRIITAAPRLVFALAMVVVLPVALAVAAVDLGALGGDTYDTLTSADTWDPEADTAVEGGGLGASIVGSLIQSAVVTVIAAPLARIVEAWYLGSTMGLAAALRWNLRGWASLVVAFVAVHVVQLVAAIALVVPGIAAMAFLSVTAPALAVEGLGPFAAMKRSFRLTKRRFFPVLGIALLAALVSGTLSLLLPALPTAIVALVGQGGEATAVSIGTIAASMLTLPFVSAVAVLTYFDLRVRTEGLDLDLEVDRW